MAALSLEYNTPGLEYVRHVMAKMPEYLHGSEIKKAWIKGGKHLVKEGKASFRKEHKMKTGNLFRSFKYTVKKGGSGIVVGFRRSTLGGGGNHAHLIDLGHRVVIRDTVTGKRVKGSLFWSQVKQRETRPAAKIIGDAMLEAYGFYLAEKAKHQPRM